MRLLIVSPYPLDCEMYGAMNRIYHLVRGLKLLGIEVQVLSPKIANSSIKSSKYKALMSFFPLTQFPKVMTLDFLSYSWNPFFICAIMKFVYSWDPNIIQFESSILNPVLIRLLKKISHNEVKMVIDAHNVHAILSKERGSKTYLYMKALEKATFQNANLILAMSPVDREHILNLYKVSSEKVAVVPNGVGIEQYSSSNQDLHKFQKFQNDSYTLFYHGKFDYYPNREAFLIIKKFIIPALKERLSRDFTFIVAGGGLRFHPNKDTNIRYIGYIDNLVSVINEADICVVPLMHGSGTRIKILEYMAAGKPIVTTKKGAEGIDFEDKKDGLVVNTVDNSFIEAILRLLSNPSFASHLGEQAKQKAFSKYCWSSITSDLLKIYNTRLFVQKGLASSD